MSVTKTIGQAGPIWMKIKAIIAIALGIILFIFALIMGIIYENLMAILGGILVGLISVAAGILWWKRAKAVEEMVN